MRLGTPRSEQGQTVERSYGWHEGALYLRVHDRSDGEVTWFRADEESANDLPEGYDPGGETYPPSIETWTPCQEPE